MQILFIIGNGFDLNLGLKTKYSDFYEYYKNIKSDKESIRKLKNHLNNNIDTWSDLEKSLGEYTEFINSEEEFDEVFEDIGDRLGEYLKLQEDQYIFDGLDIENLYTYLGSPESPLSRADQNRILPFKDRWKKWNVNIITLNYTTSLDRLLGENTSNLKIGNFNETGIFLKSFEHLHGYCDNRMIIGVNDLTQLKNVKFHKNLNITEAIIKANCNKSLKHTIDDLCKRQISSANLICIFGSSIGDTDKIWWELIGERLKEDDSILIIYDKCEDIPSRIAYKKARKEREMKTRFLSKTNLNQSEIEIISDKIFVGINTEMFKLSK